MTRAMIVDWCAPFLSADKARAVTGTYGIEGMLSLVLGRRADWRRTCWNIERSAEPHRQPLPQAHSDRAKLRALDRLRDIQPSSEQQGRIFTCRALGHC